MKQYLLGIDVGTTGTKALLFSADGERMGHAYRSYPLSTPQVGWSEQRAEDWWEAVVATVREICDGHDYPVAAISLSLQGGTMVPVDENGNALRPAIVWNDHRGAAQKEAFLQEVGDDAYMYRTTGWHLGNNLPVLETRWIRDNEPEIFAKTRYFLSVPDYISMKMTGIPAVDLSDAGINQFCDVCRGTYDENILKFAGISEEKLPKIFRSGEKIGNLTQEAAQELGLSTDTVVVAGAHDQYAVALGAGATRPGDMLIGSGTCWVITAMCEKPDFSSGRSQSVAATPDTWGTLMSLSSGGVCLDWLRKNVVDETTMSYEAINREVAEKKAAENGLFFYPFSGKCSNKKRFRKASFVGLDLSHDRFDMARAVMEGVVFQILWMMEEFPQKPSEEGIILSGGASKSEVWAQLLADISGLPVRIPEVADLACVGAAVMAGVGCGLYTNTEEGYRALSVKERVLQPDLEKTRKYADLSVQYRKTAEKLAKE